jgi:HPt (histidine-containing phosphotransfer) domain-containing protein
MRKDSINPKSLEAAYLIYKEHGHKIVDYDFSHPPTDYKKGTVEEPEQTSKLRSTYSELLPPEARNREFNALAQRDDEIEKALDNLQQAMVTSRRMGNFQMLQNQMKQMQELIKEKERIDAKMAVANLGAAQMDVYHDTMGEETDEFSELQDIGSQIAALEEKMKEYLD